jgi:hypothetical protein
MTGLNQQETPSSKRLKGEAWSVRLKIECLKTTTSGYGLLLLGLWLWLLLP